MRRGTQVVRHVEHIQTKLNLQRLLRSSVKRANLRPASHVIQHAPKFGEIHKQVIPHGNSRLVLLVKSKSNRNSMSSTSSDKDGASVRLLVSEGRLVATVSRLVHLQGSWQTMRQGRSTDEKSRMGR